MSTSAAPSVAQQATRPGSRRPRVAFLGDRRWLEDCAPPVLADGVAAAWVPTEPVGTDWERALSAVRSCRSDAVVVFDPGRLPAGLLRELPGVTLGLHLEPTLAPELAEVGAALDRVASCFPSLTGERVGAATVWRAFPPPVSDALFAEVRRPRTSMEAMTIGAASEHRERLLLPAKHHHDLLEIVHGLHGSALLELLREYDIAVHVPSLPGGAFGGRIGMHLAAGQLLLCEAPTPAHGLERNIDYLHFDSPNGLVWILERLQRFPEMYHRIRVRGRMKAEQYRASRLFARIAQDLCADVRAFGSPRSSS